MSTISGIRINEQVRVIEPFVDDLLERVKEAPQLTIGNLIEEIMHLLGQLAINEHEQAQSVLEGRLKSIRRKNCMETLIGEEQEFFNISRHLIDRQGKVSEVCLKHLKQIPLKPSFETEEAFESHQIELREKHLFKKLKGFLSIPNYQKAADEILQAPSLYNFSSFLHEEVLEVQLLPLSQSILQINEMIGKELIKNHFPPFPRPKIIFGKAEWEKYFGNIGEEPPLPMEIIPILKNPCPFWAGFTIEQTHLLILIPKKVDGTPFTLNLLQQIVQKPKGQGNPPKYRHYHEISNMVQNEYGNRRVDSSYWALVTKYPLPTSQNKNFLEQKNLIISPYAMPRVLEIALASLAHYVETTEVLYFNICTRCEEVISDGHRLLVGNWDLSCLVETGRSIDNSNNALYQLSLIRRF